MKKVLLTLLILIGSAKCFAADGDEFEDNGILYTVISENDKTCRTKAGSPSDAGNPDASGELKIPSQVTNNGTQYTVTEIGEYSFFENKNLTGSLTLPSTIKSIGSYAYGGCSGFNGTLTLPKNLTSIGSDAFHGCSGFTGDLKIPDGVTLIGWNIFDECSGFNGTLTLPENLTSIGWYAFRRCSGFTGDLKIPNSVTSIGSYAFQYCSGFNGTLTLPDNLTSIGDRAFCECSGFNGTLTLPGNLTSISWQAFFGCSGFNGSLTLPENLTSLEKGVFYGCTGFNGSLTLPESIKSIGSQAFNNCPGLTAVYYEGNLYDWCKIDFESYDSNPLYYAHHLFIQGTELTELTIPDDIIEIKTATFTGASYLTGNLIIPDRITSIGSYAFYGCSGFTGDLKIQDSVTSISSYAFYGCSGFNGNLTLPENLTSIGSSAFEGCSGFNGSLTLPDNLTSIGSYAFRNCSGFNGDLNIPDSVTELGSSAFRGCSGFTGDLKIPYGVTEISSYAFESCSGFNGNLTLPENLTSIGSSAFQNCSGLTSIILPAELEKIDSNGIYNCSSLKYIISLNENPPTAAYFFNYFNNVPLIVPKGVVENYRQAEEWQKFQTIVYPILNLEQADPEKQTEEFKLKVDENLICQLKIDFSEPISVGPESISDFTWNLQQSGDFIEVKSEDNKTFSIIGKEIGEAVIKLESKLFNTSTEVKIEVIPTPAEAVALSLEKTLKCTHDHTGLKAGENLQLVALVSPETTTYKDITWSVEDPATAEVSEEGLVHLLKAGTVKVTATVTETPDVSASYEINVAEAVAGDSNDSGSVNVADVLTTAQAIVENEVNAFCHANADADVNGTVDSNDIAATVNIILGINPSTTVAYSTRTDVKDYMSASYNGESKISVALTAANDYTTLQADVILPEGMVVKNVVKGSRMPNHDIVYNITEEGVLKVVIFSLTNSTFAATEGSVFEIEGEIPAVLDGLDIEEIYASTAGARQYSIDYQGLFSEPGYTGVESIAGTGVDVRGAQGSLTVYNAEGMEVTVYTLSGGLIRQGVTNNKAERYSLAPGIYLVKVADHTFKVSVR